MIVFSNVIFIRLQLVYVFFQVATVLVVSWVPEVMEVMGAVLSVAVL